MLHFIWCILQEREDMEAQYDSRWEKMQGGALFSLQLPMFSWAVSVLSYPVALKRDPGTRL